MSCKISYRIRNTKKSHEPLKAPCQYNEYRLVGEPEESKNPDGKRTIELALTDTMMTSVKEAIEATQLKLQKSAEDGEEIPASAMTDLNLLKNLVQTA